MVERGEAGDAWTPSSPLFGRAAPAREGAKCLRKTFVAPRESAIAEEGTQEPATFFFHAAGAAPPACGARARRNATQRRARAPRTNSAFFTVFSARVVVTCALRAASCADAGVARTGAAAAVDVKLSKKSCARVVDSKKNRD